jgi:hypothetical protein
MCAVLASSNRKSAGQLIAIAAVMSVGYLCVRTLRFTYEELNLIFTCAFLLTPFLAIRPVLRLGRWPKLLGTIFLTPLLSLSLLLLLFSAACGNFGRHPELVRDLSAVRQGRYSVHLVRDASGGALGPQGLSVQQRMTVVPGLYLVKYVDFLDGAYEGSLSAEPSDKVRVHILKAIRSSRWEHGGEEVYSLKPNVYF